MNNRLRIVGLAVLLFLVSACGNEFPEAEGDLTWLFENGAIDEVPDGWEQTDSHGRKGYELGGERFPTLATRDYETNQSAVEAEAALTDLADDAGWELGWSVCFQKEARIGFRHPSRDDVLLTSILTPEGDSISIKITGIFDQAGWAREGSDSMECFEGVRERLRMLDELPPLQSLDAEVIESRLTASEVADIFGKPGITSRKHDGQRIQYRDGEEFVLVVEKVYGNDLPELYGFDRDDIYVIEEQDHATTYRVGLGDASVDLVDYTKSDLATVEQLASALQN